MNNNSVPMKMGSLISMAMRTIFTELIIDAPIEKVWAALSDFSQYATWNPFIIYAKGTLQPGKKISVIVKAPGEKPRLFKPKIIKVTEGKEFRWLGKMLLPGVFDVEHIFCLSSVEENKTKFVHNEHFKGLLVPLLWGRLEWSTLAGFKKMNKALKDLCEQTDE
ncbi:MAG: SRPBCC domain-containing protein [Calditrichaeota bacterium]|nr:SRPBCC domain-containing protein [Calditrichota bacterium]